MNISKDKKLITIFLLIILIIGLCLLSFIFYKEKIADKKEIEYLEKVIANLESKKKQTKECFDVLEKAGTKPKGLVFIGCGESTEQVLFSANYRVAGSGAEAVEKFLQEKYKMNELVFHCCTWESNGYNSLSSPILNYSLFIEMYSDETLLQDRDSWEEIPFFYVDAEVMEF